MKRKEADVLRIKTVRIMREFHLDKFEGEERQREGEKKHGGNEIRGPRKWQQGNMVISEKKEKKKENHQK